MFVRSQQLRQPTTEIAGIRSYRLRTGVYASVSACLDHISAKKFLPDQEHLIRGEILHDWATRSLAGEALSHYEGFGPDEFFTYIQPILDFFNEKRAKFLHIENTLHSPQYRIAGTPDLAGMFWCSVPGAQENWIVDLKFCEQLIERYDFQLHGYRMFEPLRGYRMGLLQVNRAGRLRFVEVPYDSNKTTLLASAANVLRWQIGKAARDLTEYAQ